jgi:putative hydroxymethylpyrimidine transport system ATP-binding protein
MDEPFSALDTMTRYQLHETAVALLQQKTVLFVSHDPHEALRLAHEIYIMQKGKLQHVASLDSPTPRAPHHSDFLSWQPILFRELMHE